MHKTTVKRFAVLLLEHRQFATVQMLMAHDYFADRNVERYLTVEIGIFGRDRTSSELRPKLIKIGNNYAL